MKTFDTLNVVEREEILLLFGKWLSPYSNDVVIRVMENAEEIINNNTFK